MSYILHSPGLASRRRRPLSSNVRPHEIRRPISQTYESQCPTYQRKACSDPTAIEAVRQQRCRNSVVRYCAQPRNPSGTIFGQRNWSRCSLLIFCAAIKSNVAITDYASETSSTTYMPCALCLHSSTNSDSRGILLHASTCNQFVVACSPGPAPLFFVK